MSELLLTLTSLKHCLPSGYLEPMAAQTTREFGSSGWFHYAARCLCCKRRVSMVFRLSIARDYVKWFISMKEVTDIAEPELMRFLNEQPNLNVVG